MDPITAKLMSAAGGGVEEGTYVDDVFSTFLYEGTGTARAINNGIDLSGEGGMVWVKARNTDIRHGLFDTEQGAGKALLPNENWAQVNNSSSLVELLSFNSNGFTLGASSGYQFSNASGNDYVSWTFRKCPGFFDVVTWTGNGTSGRTISHNLGSVPGSIWVKRLSAADNWWVYHRSVGNTKYLYLNSSIAGYTGSEAWNNTTPTASVFTVGNDTAVNANGETYIAYIFAHDDQSFGDDGDEAVIKCGSYTGNGTTSNEVNVVFEPQWLLIKTSTASGHSWYIFDTMRGIVSGGNDASLLANSSNAEDTSFSPVELTSTGFKLTHGSTNAVNGSSQDYIYIAIRRPHKPPSAATDVFDVQTHTSDVSGALSSSTITADALISVAYNSSTYNKVLTTRLLEKYFYTNTTAAPNSGSHWAYDEQTGIRHTDWFGAQNIVDYTFKRAPGFFDVVTYTGTGSNQTVSHNLGVTPELMIVKRRDSSGAWRVYSSPTGAGKYLRLDSNAEAATTSTRWNNTAPTSTVFTVGTASDVNGSGGEFIAYLFASLDGISKIGSYTGTGSARNLDFGFTAGARFFLYKRTDDSQNWVVFDTGRGITAGTDYGVPLNEVDAQFSGDYVDPYNAGISLTGSVANNSGATFIYLAIA